MIVCVCPVSLFFLINFLDLSSSSQNATRPRFRPSGEMIDYYSVYEDITTERPSLSTTSEDPEPCNYSLCVEQQQTCGKLAEVTGCLCPGLERQLLPPSPPFLSLLTQHGEKGVEVNWCAPTSIVTHYIVLVRGMEKVMDKKIQVEEKKRATVLQDVASGSVICVIAVNKFGTSEEGTQSCSTFQPQQSESGLALKLGIIGGVVGLIVLLILALLLWRLKKRRESSTLNEARGVL